MGTFLLPPDQVPQMWEAIKFTAVSADYVDEKFRDRYLNRLLYQLLSNKAQCFVRISDERKLQAVAITKVQTDEVRDERSLFVACLYSFEKVSIDIWKDSMEVLRKYAIKNGCKYITAWATSERISNLISSIGMRERFKSFILEV